MSTVRVARDLFLRGISLVYLFAFLSLYLQIPGLYGNQGILPVRNQLQDSGSLAEKIHHKPTLLWLAPYLGLNTEYMMDVLALLGVILSISGVFTIKFCTAPVFAALWSLYYSLYQVGQTFMWFQWDTLLLEAGFLSVILAPLRYPFRPSKKFPSPGDFITFWLPRWLLFRLMFASGIVKLQSGCPTWWSLTALNIHFESQPIPTPFAWYLHQMPTWFLKLGTVYAQIVEQLLPFLFFFPQKSVKVVAFWNQLFLQGAIIVTGNYNFFNFLTIVLCISLLDDSFFLPTKRSSRLLSVALNLVCYGFVVYLTCLYYGVRFSQDWAISSDITFTKEDFDEFVSRAVPASIFIAGVSLLAVCAYELYLAVTRPDSTYLKFLTLVITVQYIACACFIFGVSLVPYSTLHQQSNSTILPPLRKLHQRIDHLHVVNTYGLFRRMTGVGGRPEVILEGANDIQGPWKEFNFRYKPGDVNASLPYIAPHQPRLDWQMWFAALGTYHQNPWLMSLTYHILRGDQNVIALLDKNRLPFPEPPKYLKASLFHYHYTGWSQRSTNTWWRREKVGEYFPIFTRDHTPLLDYLKSMDLLVPDDVAKRDLEQVNPFLLNILNALRQLSATIDPVILIWSVINAIIIVILARSIFF